jgi:PKD repeat protein
VTFTGSGSSDPQGQTLTYAWNFGDGGTGTGASPTHTYSAIGPFTISLTVTDTSNLTGTATSKATIAPGPPVANAGGSYVGHLEVPVNFSAHGSTDPQGEVLTYAWSFGDSTTGSGVSPTHTYGAVGTYTVSLTATNTSGLSSTVTVSATIAPPPSGAVRSGLMPVSGAHVYLFAANTTGYGQPSVSLLNAASTGLSDSVGAYVSTAQDGSFIWTGNYICTPGAQVYAYALGGNAGNGNNAASGLLAILGSCPSAGSFPTANPLIWVNEVSTVASAYAFSGFATDAVHVSSSGTALAQVGIANAFANAGNLATLSTGVALATTPAGNGTAPQATINTLADILAACVNTDSSTSNACSTLFSNAESSGSTGTLATDTATAAINIAHNPGSNIAPLYALSTANPPFSNALTAQPNDFTIGLSFTGGGLNGSATAIAIDGSGNAWVAVHLAGIGGGQVGALSEFSSTGVALSPSIGFTGGGLYYPEAVAIDGSGDVWITNLGIASVSKFSNAGAALSPSSGFTGGGVGDAYSIAIDGSGDAWVANSGAGVLHGSVSEFSSAGVALSPSTGYTGGGLDGARSIAVDGSGNAWITNPNLYGSGSNTLSKLSSGGVALSPSTGDTGGGLYDPVSIAIDSSGDAWAVNAVGSVSKFSHVGAALSPSTGGLYDVGGYFGGGLSSDGSIAIDGSGNAWIANYDSGSLSEFSSTGTPLSPSSGYGGKAISGTVSSSGIAIDGSGDVWTVFYNAPAALYETIGVATPVITPISAGLPATPTSDGSSKLGTRP